MKQEAVTLSLRLDTLRGTVARQFKFKFKFIEQQSARTRSHLGLQVAKTIIKI